MNKDDTVFPYEATRDHYIDPDAYHYKTRTNLLYWRLATMSDILRAPNDDKLP